jgi:hypothetical protein
MKSLTSVSFIVLALSVVGCGSSPLAPSVTPSVAALPQIAPEPVPPTVPPVVPVPEPTPPVAPPVAPVEPVTPTPEPTPQPAVWHAVTEMGRALPASFAIVVTDTTIRFGPCSETAILLQSAEPFALFSRVCDGANLQITEGRWTFSGPTGLASGTWAR